MRVNDLILMIFPIALFILLFFKASQPKEQGLYFENPFELSNTRALKGFAALGIILHHLVQKITEYGAVYKGPVSIFNWMGILFTSLFFFFSGYGLIISKESKENYIDTFLSKRMPCVLIPFYVSNIIYYLTIGVNAQGIENAKDVWLSLSGLRLINTNTWFIVEIIIFYLVFYLASKKLKDTDAVINVILIVSIIMITSSLLLGHDYHNGAARNLFQGEWWYNTTILFYVGMKYARNENRLLESAKKNYKRKTIITGILFMALFTVSIIVTENIGYYQEWEGHAGYVEKAVTLIFQIAACILFVALTGLICMRFKFSNKMINFAGKISLEVYIIHDFVKRTLIDEHWDGNDFAFILLVYIISIGLAFVLNYVDGWLIRMWQGRNAYFNREPQSYEEKMKILKVKSIFKKCLAVLFLLIALITVLAVVDVYKIIVGPKTVYDEEMQALANARVGDVVTFGSYDIDQYRDKKDQVPWIVLEKRDDRVLLITEDVIERYSFHNKYEAADYSTVDCRNALYEYLYMEMFNRYEKKAVVLSELESKRADGTIVKTQDKLFYLSVDEAEKYFESDEDRRAVATKMAEFHGVNINAIDKGSWWWLRDMSTSDTTAYTVTSKGEISKKGQGIGVASGGIRPAVWVNINGG